MGDLFAAAGVAVPTTTDLVTRRRQARLLLVHVDCLTLDTTDDFPAHARAVARRAERLGAHSIARAVRWYAHPDALGRHGYDAMTIRLEGIARRWVMRVEVDPA